MHAGCPKYSSLRSIFSYCEPSLSENCAEESRVTSFGLEQLSSSVGVLMCSGPDGLLVINPLWCCSYIAYVHRLDIPYDADQWLPFNCGMGKKPYVPL